MTHPADLEFIFEAILQRQYAEKRLAEVFELRIPKKELAIQKDGDIIRCDGYAASGSEHK